MYMYLFIYLCIYSCTHTLHSIMQNTQTYIYICIYIYIYMCVCVYSLIINYTYTHTHTHIYIYIHMLVCVCLGFCGCALLHAKVMSIKLELIMQSLFAERSGTNVSIVKSWIIPARWTEWGRVMACDGTNTLKYIEILHSYATVRSGSMHYRTFWSHGSVKPTTEAPKEWSGKVLHHANLCSSAGEAGESGGPTGVGMGFVWSLAELQHQQLCQGGRCSFESP